MGVVVLAAVVWPFVLLALGLVIGRSLRRGDSPLEDRPSALAASRRLIDLSGSGDSRPIPVPLPGAGVA